MYHVVTHCSCVVPLPCWRLPRGSSSCLQAKPGWTYIHIHVCMYVCMYVYIYIYIYTHICTQGTQLYVAVCDGCAFFVLHYVRIVCADYVRIMWLIMCGLCAGLCVCAEFVLRVCPIHCPVQPNLFQPSFIVVQPSSAWF